MWETNFGNPEVGLFGVKLTRNAQSTEVRRPIASEPSAIRKFSNVEISKRLANRLARPSDFQGLPSRQHSARLAKFPEAFAIEEGCPGLTAPAGIQNACWSP